MFRSRNVRLTVLITWLAISHAVANAQTLVWSDEFDGAVIDSSIWTYNAGNHGFGNGELQYHTARPENVFIEDGNLVIVARDDGYLGSPFSSSRLTTHGRLAFKYGTVEALIKVPDVDNGLWPAFWLLGNNIGQLPWPACGEIDIMEVGRRDGFLEGVVNQRVVAAAHWDYQGNLAAYGSFIDHPTPLFHDYHLFSLDWTPTLIRAFLDGFNYWTIDISDVETNSLEEFHEPMFLIANLSVGGWNFVEITDPDQITAPFPAKMYIDYIRLYDNGHTELYFGDDIAEEENFGIFTETTPVNNAVQYDSDASLYLWNNLTPVSGTAWEGSEAWHMIANPGEWFGMGVFSHIDRNMENYSDGYLHLHMKTTSTAPFKIGVKSSAAGESWVQLIDGQESFGLVRDGSWREVLIPLNRFLNVDFNTINQLFMLAGDPPPGPVAFSIDNVYWSPSVERPTPQEGNFGIFTENPAHQTAGTYELGVDGEFYIWENTLQPAAQNPFEGDTSMALSSTPGLSWFGAAFTPDIKHNLTAFRYPDSRLHVALKTASTTTFLLGMRSGNVNDIGQKWIKFQPGNDPYGFVRDGQWHVLEIPMTDILDAVDLSEVSMLFELLGVDGPISHIEFDDVCLTGGGLPLPDGSDSCPADLNADGTIDAADLALLLGGWGATENNPADLNTDGTIDAADLALLLGSWGTCP